jgi:hypothetical protein
MLTYLKVETLNFNKDNVGPKTLVNKESVGGSSTK